MARAKSEREEGDAAGDGPETRRDTILRAALDLFLTEGYAATTIADIRAASGASTGSIYHFFGSKGAIAAALLDDARAGWSAIGTAAPDAAAEVAIKASVAGLVRWASDNSDRFRFMDELRNLALTDPDLADVGAALAAGQRGGAAAWRRYVAAGAVRPLPWPVAYSAMLGPAYAWLRLPDEMKKPGARRSAELLAVAAWEAVRAPGAARRRTLAAR